MKRPYTGESWTRFKELMRNLIKRTAIVETRAKNNEDDIAELQPAVEDLQEFADNVNDITTMPNLLRGTMRFTPGTDVCYSYNGGDWYSDGFRNFGGFTFLEDENGYSVAHRMRSGLSSDVWDGIDSSIIRNLHRNDKITVFFEFMYDDVSSVIGQHIMYYKFLDSKDYSNMEAVNLSLNDFGYDLSNLKAGQWYPAVAHLTVSVDTENDCYGYVRLQVQRNASLNFRKLGAYPGHIKDPIYSVSPADLALEPINDITTMPNLLRGTGDFVADSTKEAGFAFNKVTFFKDAEGFTVASISQTGGTGVAGYLDTSYAATEKNKQYTFAFDLLIDDYDAVSNKNLLNIYKGATKTSFAQSAMSMNTLGITKDDEGHWITVKTVVTSYDISDGYIYFRLQLSQNGSIHIKKCRLYPGFIEHPEWSANPFDVVSSSDWNQAPHLLGFMKTDRKIPSGDDLNNYHTPGTYYQSQGSDAGKIANRPFPEKNDAFRLDVIAGTGTNWSTIQRFLSYVGDEAIRVSTGDADTKVRKFGNWIPIRLNNVIPIEGGGTGGSTVEAAQNSLMIRNSTGRVSDINSMENRICVYTTESANMPNYESKYGLVFQYSSGQDIKDANNWRTQIAFPTTTGAIIKPSMFFRNNINQRGWSRWNRVITEGNYSYNPGLYVGESISAKFEREIGSSHIANWLSSRVSQGNFEGLNIGDWVDIILDGVSVRYRIAAIDPYYTAGDSVREHHIVMVPNAPWTLSTAKDGNYAVGSNNAAVLWNETDTNNGTAEQKHPYLVSNLHKWEIEVHLKRFPTAWQDVMISNRVLLETRYSASSKLTDSNGSAWVDLGKIWSLSETNVYGQCIYGSSPYSEVYECQYPLFSQIKDRIKARAIWWLRTPRGNSSTEVCYVGSSGIASSTPVTTDWCRPLPCFLIG